MWIGLFLVWRQIIFINYFRFMLLISLTVVVCGLYTMVVVIWLQAEIRTLL